MKVSAFVALTDLRVPKPVRRHTVLWVLFVEKCHRFRIQMAKLKPVDFLVEIHQHRRNPLITSGQIVLTQEHGTIHQLPALQGCRAEMAVRRTPVGKVVEKVLDDQIDIPSVFRFAAAEECQACHRSTDAVAGPRIAFQLAVRPLSLRQPIQGRFEDRVRFVAVVGKGRTEASDLRHSKHQGQRLLLPANVQLQSTGVSFTPVDCGAQPTAEVPVKRLVVDPNNNVAQLQLALGRRALEDVLDHAETAVAFRQALQKVVRLRTGTDRSHVDQRGVVAVLVPGGRVDSRRHPVCRRTRRGSEYSYRQ